MTKAKSSTRGLKGSRKRDEHGILLGDHRCTPEPFWRAALRGIGASSFDLDPATNAHATLPARTRYMGPLVDGNDGLALPWFGNVWVNFPFSNARPWIDKIMSEAYRCRSITVLGPNDSSANWHQDMARFVDAKADWPRRLHFPTPWQPKGSPPAAISLWYVGPQSNGWRRVMIREGCVTSPGVTDGHRSLLLGPRMVKKPRPLVVSTKKPNLVG